MGVIARIKQALSPVDNRGWWPWVREAFAGAWQQNVRWSVEDVSAYHAVYACITLISSDVAKLPVNIMYQDANGIWLKTKKADERAYPKEVLSARAILRRPNSYQNHIQFKKWWVTCKLLRGNVYALIQRDTRGAPVALHILDPDRVTVLVAPDGEVYYQLNSDNLSGLQAASITVPASEIIHDRMCCLFHPLVGVSPLYASGLAAHQGLKIQNDSARFFANGARPGGILSAPGAISEDTAKSLKAYWEENFTGDNSGKVAVVGDNLKFEQMRMKSADAQLLEQLKWSAQVVCSAFHVPAYKIGVGPVPPNNNIEALTVEYYQQCLQVLFEDFELCMDEGLRLPEDYRVELDLDALFRMDSSSLVKMLSEGVKGTLVAPNEGRRRLNLPPIEGGDTVYSQQQNYSLAALSRRDSREDPFAKSDAEPPPADDPDEIEAQARLLATMVQKEIALALCA